VITLDELAQEGCVFTRQQWQELDPETIGGIFLWIGDDDTVFMTINTTFYYGIAGEKTVIDCRLRVLNLTTGMPETIILFFGHGVKCLVRGIKQAYTHDTL
jgi:hypothetical protein